MKPVRGKSINEIDPYRDEKKTIYSKLAETILITSFNYLNDFSKFMIGLNSVLITSYFTILKITNTAINYFLIIPVILQIVTILFFVAVIFPRTYKQEKNNAPLIFNPERIISVYQNSINQKSKWGQLGTVSFVISLLSFVIALCKITL